MYALQPFNASLCPTPHAPPGEIISESGGGATRDLPPVHPGPFFAGMNVHHNDGVGGCGIGGGNGGGGGGGGAGAFDPPKSTSSNESNTSSLRSVGGVLRRVSEHEKLP